MGGEITWLDLGANSYEFTLVLYRDCNGLDLIDPTQDLEVWGHPTLTSITCNLITSTDLSPACTQVGGGPLPLDCGTGTSGGNGPGAVQKFVYRSNPIVITGSPGAGGWNFTFDSFSRNWGLTNIDNPPAYGITLHSTMYSNNDGCLDSSPQFAQDPYMLLCEGSTFQFNSGAFDPDNDSIVYSWGIPLDHFPAGSFDPPTNPAPVPFLPGYSFNNPTPDGTFAAGNIPATMDPNTGAVTFLSNTIGNFAFVQKIDTYRNGQLIGTVNRESQMIVIPCPGYNNNPPNITPPFAVGTSYEATFFAGDLINFDIIIDDMEVLQDGTPQTVTLEPSGNYFGTNLTDPNSGCDYTPCATLDQAPLIQGVQGLTTNFNWQTSCDHLYDACGEQQESQVYTFVLNSKDDYCQVPGRTYETIRITLLNKEILPTVDLHCVDVLSNGDVDLTWTPTADVSGVSFVEYQVWSVQDGLIANIPTIGTGNYSVVGANADLGSKDYFIKTIFGCGGNNESSSDTLSSMFLVMNDLGDGRVSLAWNNTHTPINNGENITQQIYREYPVGTWTLRGEVDYGVNFFIDTIDICSAFQSYEIRVDNSAGCTSTSNDEGAILTDIINPVIPVINWVSVDTTTDFVDISWNVNPSDDTYGYIIYALINGFWEPVDTVYGINNTTYTYTATNSQNEAETFRIAAFDSCFTGTVPPSYQTSALSPGHTTIYLEDDYDICNQTINLNWSHYMGWTVESYEVIVSIGGSPYEVIATLDANTLTYSHENLIYDVNYCYYIRAVSVDDSISYSNKNCRVVVKPSQAGFHYLASASHTLTDEIELTCYTDGSASVQSYEVEKKGPYDSGFSFLTTVPFVGSNFINYSDSDIFPERGAYEYKINLIDTCGNVGGTTNVARTIFLEVETDDVSMLNTLSWSSYQGFDGNIIEYRVYRGVNGVFDANPLAVTLPGVRSYVDDVTGFMESQGQFCYRVEAIESLNSHGFSETAFSNTVCVSLEPLAYIPNAFMINGENPIFLPIISLYDFSSYDLKIYDRWGGVIFQTNDRNEGWDGRGPLGDIKPEGTYVYYLYFEDREGKDYQYRGTVTMLIAGN